MRGDFDIRSVLPDENRRPNTVRAVGHDFRSIMGGQAASIQMGFQARGDVRRTLTPEMKGQRKCLKWEL